MELGFGQTAVQDFRVYRVYRVWGLQAAVAQAPFVRILRDCRSPPGVGCSNLHRHGCRGLVEIFCLEDRGFRGPFFHRLELS